jgi:hypothetical protein
MNNRETAGCIISVLEDLNAEVVQLATTIKKNFEELGVRGEPRDILQVGDRLISKILCSSNVVLTSQKQNSGKGIFP